MSPIGSPNLQTKVAWETGTGLDEVSHAIRQRQINGWVGRNQNRSITEQRPGLSEDLRDRSLITGREGYKMVAKGASKVLPLQKEVEGGLKHLSHAEGWVEA